VHYQHRYHAGNFADVFKHVLLCGLLEALDRKPAAWCYLESHAGAGAYDFADEAAQRSPEWREGIGRLWEDPAATALPASYLEGVRALNPDGALRHYPGSPWFAQRLARPQDRLVLCERQAPIAAQLKLRLGGDARVVLHQRDGYELAALLPPPEKRALVLIDPPFERVDEFDALQDLLERCLKRFAHGVYAIWHPVKNRYAAERWARRVAESVGRPQLRLALDTGATPAGRMHACGMLVVNPPFGFAETARGSLQVLARRLAQGARAGFSCEGEGS
jgi:23S rRNA (adenine2030-N6)-methyltransferase